MTNYSNFFDRTCIFSCFLKIFIGFLVSPASRVEKPPLGFDHRFLYSFVLLMKLNSFVSYCIFRIFLLLTECFSGFEHHEFFLAFLKKNFAFFFSILTFIVIIKVFQPNRKSPLVFDNELLENVSWPWISFQILLSQILAV